MAAPSREYEQAPRVPTRPNGDREAAARNDHAAGLVTLRPDCEQQHSVRAGRSMSAIPKDFRPSGKEKFRKKKHPFRR
jgi:hypothetical protein